MTWYQYRIWDTIFLAHIIHHVHVVSEEIYRSLDSSWLQYRVTGLGDATTPGLQRSMRLYMSSSCRLAALLLSEQSPHHSHYKSLAEFPNLAGVWNNWDLSPVCHLGSLNRQNDGAVCPELKCTEETWSRLRKQVVSFVCSDFRLSGNK